MRGTLRAADGLLFKRAVLSLTSACAFYPSAELRRAPSLPFSVCMPAASCLCRQCWVLLLLYLYCDNISLLAVEADRPHAAGTVAPRNSISRWFLRRKPVRNAGAGRARTNATELRHFALACDIPCCAHCCSDGEKEVRW